MSGTLHGDPERFAGGLSEVAPGVWAWLTPNGMWGESNAGLIVGDGAAALVDTMWDQRLTRELLAATARLTAAAPIELVVNTHSDGDHWWGNAEVPAGARIVTSQASLDAMREEAPPAALCRLRRLAATARVAPGAVGEMARYVSGMLAPFAFEHVQLRFPGETFTGERIERTGGRDLRLIEVGPAHTPGDLVVHVPDAGVVFGADILFFGVTPVLWHGPVENWIAALDTLLALDADVFVPGHGPVGGRAEVEQLRAYWVWLAEAVGRHHVAGRSAMEAARALVRDPGFARFAGWTGAERTVINVTTIHRALAGKGPVPAGPPARARLFAQVAVLAKELDERR
ncbi:MBL fold metallo-hydrolase [Conexibacter woesei]|uniref:Beta-lactamase domain protein n=1 Tax=Conexibacter woesei (strain DSM 14684 / CCUG 47730 / CIP 108061 / JCM 11494 / NBRC 100937 / ID131577) TaxID=469383 RepID=D3F8R7_CONWI|nr:MBL fold metallo-hydrolase [Conexibacter woesei]ADB51031.1 beta-lactamase domain protein [Conexibacter woesei DSM 14684]